MAKFTVIVDPYVNQAPNVVGDGTETTQYSITITYTRVMFTTNTVPPYNDPEGDAALNLKVLTLPGEGVLYINAVPVNINQIISFSDIDLGLLTYDPNDVNTNAYTTEFDFQIADAGSGIFVG